MIRAVLDTSVLISTLLFDGLPRVVLRGAIEGSYELSLCEEILDEFASVLRRPKFSLDPVFVRLTFQELEALARVYYPQQRLTVVHRDPKDNMVVDCAVAANAGYIVTGDADLLTLGEYAGVHVVTVAAFEQLLRG